MKILAISGSASPKGSNYLLLTAIQQLVQDEHAVEIFDDIQEFPLFTPVQLKAGIPENIASFKEKIIASDAVIIATPEYTHNIPAVLKNMIEWCTASAEFADKKILPITFTPSQPRGEYAMKSLNFSLKTLNANVVAELPMYKTEVEIDDNRIELSKEVKEIVLSAIELL